MNVLASSECRSGCESGWTLYLEQSFLSANPSHKDRKSDFCDEHRENRVKEEDVEDEEEDLSMVSDASSGPPHFNEDNGYFNDDSRYQYSATKGATLNNQDSKGHRNEEHRRRRKDQELPSFLDDTASSPLINFSKNNFALTNNQASKESVFDYPQGFSASHFQQGGSAFQDHFGFLQSSPSGSQLRNNQYWY
ncbi:uncharacterized protein LOC110421893 isoform X1 [Herrania umbratica]|uniref:Uncharacterized protein LOC110421893 isoform X1 n=1 Tax=Herrania umbratica TaxID=108875 RepID=A0A6J1AY14_9ROSI|nr:uncharacterized protein LOC110421893 isoform X1 [Herrania umbratica]